MAISILTKKTNTHFDFFSWGVFWGKIRAGIRKIKKFLKGSLEGLMAKTGTVDGGGDPVAAKVVELKRELQRLVKAIAIDDCDDVNLESLDRAHQILSFLKEFKIKRSLSLKLHESVVAAVPEEFRCPLSKELMRDPVIVATGQVCTLAI